MNTSNSILENNLVDELGTDDLSKTNLELPESEGVTETIDIVSDDAEAGDVTNVSFSGNNRIDSLIYPAKWTDNNITYSFLSGNKYYGSEGDIRPITSTMKGYLRDILDNLESYIDVNLTEVSDTGSEYGQLRYTFSDGPSTAYAKVPYKNKTSPKAGDVHFNRSKTGDFEAGPGSYRYETLIHETLHAFDLKHPGDYNASGGTQSGPFLRGSEDNSNNSIMSYNRLRYSSGYSGTITPMPYDIRALQYLYGAAENNGGDSTYKFDKIDEYTINGEFFGNRSSNSKQTLWDSGGKDSFDFSGLEFNGSGYRLDLRQGGVITGRNNYLDTSYKAEGNGKQYKATSRGTFLAYDMTIENVITSSSNDTIYANEGANTFSGYSKGKQTGKDILYDTNGQDTLDLSNYTVSDFSTRQNGNDFIVEFGDNGQVKVKDYYLASEGDRLQILSADGNPNPDPDPNPEPTLQDGTLVWEEQGFRDERAIPAGSELDLGNGLTAKVNWQLVNNNGASFEPYGGRDYVSYDSGELGDHKGYLSAGFNSSSNSSDNLLKVSFDFNQGVIGANFKLLDVDRSGSFEDGVEIYADGVNIKDIPEVNVITGEDVISAGSGFEGNDSVSSSRDDGNISLNFGSTEVSQLEIRYFSTEDTDSNPAGQKIGISDLDFKFQSV